MTHDVHIETVLPVPADDVLHALSGCGVRGSVIEHGPCVRLSVTDDDALALRTRVALALEALVGSRRLALVPDRVGDMTFILRPPTA